MQLINQHFGGVVSSGGKQEYGETKIEIDPSCPLFSGLLKDQTVLMSHGDSVQKLADSLLISANSDRTVAALFDPMKNIYGVQFHPEVDLTRNGKKMFENYLKGICHLSGNYTLDDRVAKAIEKIRCVVGRERVLVLVSGGVDSAVSAALLLKALKSDQVYAIHVDHGFMRKNESDQICENLKTLGLEQLIRVDAEDMFYQQTVQENGEVLGPLSDVLDPEETRRVIGNLFIRAVQDTAEKRNFNFNKMFLAQGTLRPDLIESGNPDVSDYAHKIKTHHNDIELIRSATTRRHVLETNWDWHKDEVRQVARKLGIDEQIAGRQPFPGPGLSIRVICSDGVDRSTQSERERLASLLDEGDLEGNLIALRTVGVQGDQRSYRYLALLVDKEQHTDWLRWISLGTSIPGRLDFINRVVVLLNPGKWTDDPSIYPLKLERNRISLLREVDALVREALDKPPISQVFPVLLPMGTNGALSVAIRAIITTDYMTGRPAVIGEEINRETMNRLVNAIDCRFEEIDFVVYDVTGKPPATVEWE
jgi:GMP synthase (glutamine-hydrolysing)